MTPLNWHRGPPPFVGWWNASAVQDEGAWLWWDGEAFSTAVDHNKASAAAFYAAQSSTEDRTILWAWQWPEGARVPRIDPLTGLQANTEAEFVKGRQGLMPSLARVALATTVGGGRAIYWPDDSINTLISHGLIRQWGKTETLEPIFIAVTPAGRAALKFWRDAEKRVGGAK